MRFYPANADRICDCIFYTFPAWHLSFIHQIHNGDQFTLGGLEQLYPRFQ
jgi:hypothetical protein